MLEDVNFAVLYAYMRFYRLSTIEELELYLQQVYDMPADNSLTSCK